MKRLAAVLLVTVLGATVWGAPAAGARVSGVGWWSDSPAASAPAGGIAIGASPGGPSAVAAVLLEVGDGVSSARLTLNQSGGAAPAGAAIEACVVGTFTPAEKGPMADAPATVCETTSTPVTVSADGATWTADLTDLVYDSTGTVGIALVPASGGGLFDLQFDSVSATTAAAPAGGGRTTPTTAVRPSTSPSPAGSPSPATRPATGSFTPPPAPRVPSPATSPTTVVPDVEDDGETTVTTAIAADGTVAMPTAATSGVAPDSGTSGGEAVSYALIAVVIGVGGGFVHRVASRRLAV